MVDLVLLEEQIKQRFGTQIVASKQHVGELTIEVLPENLIAVCKVLQSDPQFAFEQLIDVCGVDYLVFGRDEWTTDDATATGFGRGVDRSEPLPIDMPRRFAAVYHLLSVANNHRLRIKTFPVGDPPIVPTVTDLWSSANWFEREAFDMVGILFDGHPDLRRILTDYGFIGHPLRKDFPTSGHVEVRYDPEQQRVIYQPITIEPRVLVPKVIRHDHRYEGPEPTKPAGAP